MKKEHEKHKGMIDNKHVESSRQKGIERVLQRKGDMPTGQPGKMSDKGHAEWNRSRTTATTPRRG